MLKRILVGPAVLVAAGLLAATAVLPLRGLSQDAPKSKPVPAGSLSAEQGAPVDFSKVKDAIVVAGEVADVDTHTSCRGASDCFRFPELLLNVQHSFVRQALPRQIVIDMQIPGSSTTAGVPPAKGDQVVVVMWKAPKVTDWACGRFRTCEHAPKEIWYGLEVYKRTSWP